MSHFSHIKTKIRDLEALKQALSDLEIPWQPPGPVRGYQGQTCTAAVVIEQTNGYDIGFAPQGDEYTLVCDRNYWQQPLSVEGFLQQITQRYAYHKILQETERQGFAIATQQTQQDGSLRLVVQRWRD